MSFKFVEEVETIDSVPEKYRSFYAQDEATKKFVLDKDLAKDLGGLKASVASERKAREELEESLRKYDGIDADPEKIKEILRKEQQRAEDEAKAAGKWDDLKKQMNDKHAADIEKERLKGTRYKTALEQKLVDAEASRVIGELKGSPTLLLPHIKSRTRVVEDKDGNFDVRIVDVKGVERVNGQGEYLTIKDLVEEMRSDEMFGRAFDSEGQTGGGKQPGTTAGGERVTTKLAKDMTPQEKAAFITEQGLEGWTKKLSAERDAKKAS